MFISSSEARKRLSNDRNRLARDVGREIDPHPASPIPKSTPLDINSPESQEEEIATDDEVSEKLANLEPLVTLSQMKATLAASESEIFDFKELDKVIDLDPMDDRVGQGHGKRRFRNNTEAQTAIGEVATLTTQQTAAHLFGISQAQVHAYDNSASSSNHAARDEHKPDLQANLDRFRQLLAIKAAVRLHETLDVLDGAKLATVKKATNLSRIAKDMAGVMRNVEERLDRKTAETTVFHVWKPEMRSAESYEVVEATVSRISDGGEDLPKV